MAKIFPFQALRPPAALAAQVAAVPYDVVSRAEARQLAAGNPHAFLHVTKPEIDLPDDIDGHDDRVYSQGARTFAKMVADGVLIQDAVPALYGYALTMGGHTQTGVVFCASVREYERNVVRRHELTRPDKETDRVRHMEALQAQTGKVFLVHRDSMVVAEQMQQVTAAPPEVDFEAVDGVRHRLWSITDPFAIRTLVDAFAGLGPIYIADGHHRSAAAARVAATHRRGGSSDGPWERFLSVAFPASQVQILPYNRVVRDLNGRTASSFLQAVEQTFSVKPGKPQPIHANQFGMYLDGRWHTLTARPDSFDPRDPIHRLDVSILQNQLLAPLLGIKDPRTDQRIDFVGGSRGDDELERRVQQGWAVAFKLHPTSIDDLFAIADAEAVMPPKSTWFEPKLRDGLVVHRF